MLRSLYGILHACTIWKFRLPKMLCSSYNGAACTQLAAAAAAPSLLGLFGL